LIHEHRWSRGVDEVLAPTGADVIFGTHRL